MQFKIGDNVIFNEDCMLAFDYVPKGVAGEIIDIVDTGFTMAYRIDLGDMGTVTIPTNSVDKCCTQVKPKKDKHNILADLIQTDGSIDGEKLMEKLEENQVQVANGVVMSDRPQRPTMSASTPSSVVKRINEKHNILHDILQSDGSIDGEKLMEKLESDSEEPEKTINLLREMKHNCEHAHNYDDAKRHDKAKALGFAIELIKHDCSATEYKTEKLMEKLSKGDNKTIRPDYYKFHGYDVFDIANYFGLSFPLGNGLKYLLRAGKKDKDKTIQDLEKCVECVQREIKFLKEK